MSTTPPPVTSPTPRRKRRWLLRIIVVLLALLLVGAGSGLWYVNSVLSSSLPVLQGSFQVAGIDNTVRIERDSQGVPTLIGSNYNDLAFGLGVLHAQDRFFQMDLLRRKAAGELSALVGSAALPLDKSSRVHRFRSRMKAAWEKMTGEQQAAIRRYCDGVAWGLQQGYVSKGAKPFEYHLLRAEPQPWQPEDCLLCICSMYLELQASQITVEMMRANLYAAFDPEVSKFFDPDGTPWDAAIDGTSVPRAPLPRKDDLNLRNNPLLKPLADNRTYAPMLELPTLGSNNWAVAGKKTKHGGAIICDDMHLGIIMPNIWYRACLQWTDPDGTPRRACGVTLPGGPTIVTGSNGYIAWGFTNTEGDWLDLIGYDLNPENGGQYKTKDGWKDFVVHDEKIEVKGEQPFHFPVRETIWGPVFKQNDQDMHHAIRWVAHQPDGVNLNAVDLLKARSLEEALKVAPTCGIPHQNFVVGDRSGRIAWTIAGRIPKRNGIARGATLPGKHFDWDGFLQAADYPTVIDPEQGRIWTANNRVVGGAMFATLGNAGVDIAFRAGQIRDRLLAIEQADEKDMLKVQLDDEARSLQKWKTLFLETVPADDASNPKRSELRKFVANWDGFAHADGVGYNILDRFSREVRLMVYQPIDSLVLQKSRFNTYPPSLFQQTEGPLWEILKARPDHLLHPAYQTWTDLLKEAANRVTTAMQTKGIPFEQQTWGSVNATKVRHPLSQAIPFAGRWLDLPDAPLSGARHDLPRITSPGHGASERFAVSPGKEEQGIFHMPGGQSGHPLSPYYRDGHAAWEQGLPTPFLPGTKVNEIIFEKAK